MKRSASIFQYGEGWYGLSLVTDAKGIHGIEFYPDSTTDELSALFKDQPTGVSIDPSTGYVVMLRFPFSGRRKIGLVIREELEEFFPFPVEEMSFDFQEQGKGDVLVAAARNSLVEGLKWGDHIRSVTLNGLSTLYALRYLNLIARKNFIFLHVEGKVAVAIAFRNGKPFGVRQFFHSRNEEVILEAVTGYLSVPEFAPEAAYIMGDDDILKTVGANLVKTTGLTVESPSLSEYFGRDDVPGHAWSGVGSALLALGAKEEVNLISPARGGVFHVDRRAVFACAGALALSLTLFGASYFNLFLKEKALQNLARQETAIYRTVFPKAPPTKDIERVFDDKVKAVEKDRSGVPASQGISPLAILAELSSKIDNQIDVKISEYVNDGDEFVITGTTVSFASVEKIKGVVEQARGVKEAEIQNVDLAGARQVKFRIRGKL